MLKQASGGSKIADDMDQSHLDVWLLPQGAPALCEMCSIIS
jgi:hypothetical protein